MAGDGVAEGDCSGGIFGKVASEECKITGF